MPVENAHKRIPVVDMPDNNSELSGRPGRINANPTRPSPIPHQILLDILLRDESAVEALEQLMRTIAGTARDARPERRPKRTKNNNYRGAYIDFSRCRFRRATSKAAPLPRGLPTELLQQLCRGPVPMELFLLLPRARMARPPGKHKQLLAALRHEKSMLCRMLQQLGFGIRVQRFNGKLYLRNKRAGARTNVARARAMVRKSRQALAERNLASAVNLAERALRIDPDCTPAADVIHRVLQLNPDALTKPAVEAAELSFTRALIRYVSGKRRVESGTVSNEASMAVEVAKGVLRHLDRKWNDLLAWRFDKASSDGGDRDNSGASDFFEMWVHAFRGDVLGVSRFRTHPVISEVIDRFLGHRLEDTSVEERQEAREILIQEAFQKLVVNTWMPAPPNRTSLQVQLQRFLWRRIDWDEVLHRSSIGMTQLHDAMEIVDERGLRQERRRGARSKGGRKNRLL